MCTFVKYNAFGGLTDMTVNSMENGIGKWSSNSCRGNLCSFHTSALEEGMNPFLSWVVSKY